MADVNPQDSRHTEARGPLFYIGAAGLLLAMAVEAVSVIGRHIGVPLLGAIEIIQSAILLTATAAMVSTTICRAHARVTLLADRVGPSARGTLKRISALLSVLFFAGLAAGSLWLTVDTWSEFEESELLHISFRPLRLVSFAGAAVIAALFLRELFRRTGERR